MTAIKMKKYVVEFEIELPAEWDDPDIDLMLYQNGLKHFNYEWSVGRTISAEDV